MGAKYYRVTYRSIVRFLYIVFDHVIGDSSVGIVTSQRAGQGRNRSWIPFKSKEFYLLGSVVSVSGNSKFLLVWYQV
jgi:hypothetical protein